jgi:hypothetical protein
LGHMPASMNPRKMFLFLIISQSALPPVAAQTACQLCAALPSPVLPAKAPLRIDISTLLDFSTAAHTDSGQGSIEIDPRTGQRRVTGLIALGGMALKGTVRLTGEPFRRVRISLPTQIQMVSTMGAKAEITSIVANVSPDPMLGSDGSLTFSFGGRMTVLDGAAGEFHARIPITAEYQ